MRLAAAVLFGSLVLAAACGREEAGPPDQGDAALEHVLSGYVVDFLRRNPTASTYLGGAGLDPSLREVDGTLRDHSAQALEGEDAWLRATQRAIEAVAVDSLSPAARIDRDVALAQIRFLLRQHGVRRYQERALDTYVGEPVQSIEWQIQRLTPTGEKTAGTPEEWMLVIRRLHAIPGFLATAQAQLEAGVVSRRIPDWRMAQRDGLEAAEAHGKYFAETLPALAAERLTGPERDRLRQEVRAAAQQAAEAYLAFRDFVAATYFVAGAPKYGGDRFALGEQEYDWAILNPLRIPYHAWTIYDAPWSAAELTIRPMVDVARAIGARRGLPLPEDDRAAVRVVLEALSRDHSRSDADMVSWYRDAATRFLESVRQTGMFSVPDDYRLEILRTPPSLRPLLEGAAYYPAPPFEKSLDGRFYVTPGNDLAVQRPESRASLAHVAAREGFPGYGWYFDVLAESPEPISPVRWLTPGAVADSSSMWLDSMAIESWGGYAAALLAERRPGAAYGFYTAEERLYQLWAELGLDVRMRIDVGIHTGRMTYADAVTRLSEVADFLPGSCAPYIGTALQAADGGTSDVKRSSCARAEREAFRSSKWPTLAAAHRIGRNQMHALLGEAMGRLGDRFSRPAFHRLVITQGPVPPGYFREALLSELDRLGS